MSGLSFSEAMDVTCGWCGDKASQHRLTDTGRLYCLDLSAKGKRYRQTQVQFGDDGIHHWRDDMVLSIPVKYLRPARFDKEVGQAILNGLTHYENIEAV